MVVSTVVATARVAVTASATAVAVVAPMRVSVALAAIVAMRVTAVAVAGLTAFAVSIGAGRLVPAVAGGPQELYSAVGVLFAVIGILVIVYGRKRGREVDTAISEGRYQRADERVLSVIAGVAAIGGLLLIVLILVGR